MVDLNADGDLTDWVAMLVDQTSGSLLNTGTAEFANWLGQDVGVFRVAELDQGFIDLNADGDLNDKLLFLLTCP